jgi:predicted dehydrogenase
MMSVQPSTGAERIYRAGIVGLGFIGGADQVSGDRIGQSVADLDGTHLESLAGNPRIRLVAGSSRDAGRRQRFASRTGARTYADWTAMLRSERLDIVSIATYAPLHARMTLGCLEHGVRAIYCEKPIATGLADAEKMVACCNQAGVLLVINHNRRFNPNYHRLREWVSDGGLGQLTSVSLQWASGRLAGVGTHIFDALRMLTRREVQAVSATLDPSGRPDCRGTEFSDPGGWALLRLDGGVTATVDASDYSAVPAQIVLNGTLGRAITGGGDVRIELWNGQTDFWPSPRQTGTSMDRAVAQIVAWLESAANFSYSADEAVRSLEVILAFHAPHARNAAWIRLPLRGAERTLEVRAA